MSFLSPPSRSLRAAAGAALLIAVPLAAFDGHAAPAAVPAGYAVAPSDVRDLGVALAQARIESEAAEAALEAAQRIATPGHLLDPLPARLMAGLGELQAEYAEMERKAAGYRATLGDQHPTLKGAEEVMAELRGQILDGARRAGVAARQDVTRARAAVASLERQVHAVEATNSIAPPVPSPTSAALPATDPRSAAAAPVEPAPRTILRQDASMQHATPVWTAGLGLLRMIAGALLPLVLRYAWTIAVAGLLAVSLALGLLVALSRPRARRRPEPAAVRIEPSAPVEATPAPTVLRPTASLLSRVAVLATLPLRADDDPAAVLIRLEREADSALEQTAASVFATLAAASGLDRVGVAVTSAAGAPDAQVDAVALALAAAAAGAGHRVLLVDGHPDDRLGRVLGCGAVVATIADANGRVRTISRLRVGDRVLAVLTRDTAMPASGRAPARLPNLDGFDAIVIAGEPGSVGAVASAFALVVAPHGAAAADLAAAARIAAGEAGHPCGVVLVESVGVPIADTVEAPRPPEAAAPRRRAIPEAATARLGLRRSFEPAKRRRA